MAVIKCSKCGADIPDNAAFCPACGAPKGEVQQPKPVQPQPVRMATSSISRNSSPLEGLFNMVFSKTAIIFAIAIGILFAWIGVLIMIFASGSTNIAMFLSSMGFAAMGLFLLCGGIWNRKINAYTRIAMVLAGGFFIVNALSIMSLLTSIFSSLYSGIPGFS